MGALQEYAWIGYFAAAYIVSKSKRGNGILVIALIVLGLQTSVPHFVYWGFLDSSLLEFHALLQWLQPIGIVLLVVGLLSLRNGMPADGGIIDMQGAAGTELASLFTPRNDTNTYSRAEALRDEACAQLVSRATQAGIEVVEQRSQAHSPGVWFRLDYLLPSDARDLSLRASVTVQIERLDFHRYEHTFSLSVQVGAKIKEISGVIALTGAALDRIHKHVVTPGDRLRLHNRVRQLPWQLWRPRNKVTRLGPDWGARVLIALGLLALLIPVVGVFVALALFIALYFRNQRRRTYVLTTGKPLTDPRALTWMDSWQVSVGGMSAAEKIVNERIISGLKSSGPEGSNISIERFGYWGTDSWVERDQIVARHRRAIGFISVVPYGDVLYVAWECHLNSASWVEQRLAEGVDRSSGLNVVANRVVAGSHRLNEYDVSDSNFVAEWMHESVKRVLRLTMTEQQIDQEIDFTVQRESRKTVLSDPEQPAAANQAKSNRFKRVV